MIYRCDHEVGSPANGWHTCARPAAHRRQSIDIPGVWLWYCDDHKQHGRQPEEKANVT